MTNSPGLGIERLVVKVGSSVLTDAFGRVLTSRIDQLAEELAHFHGGNRKPVLVSSGAIACGMAALGLSKRPAALAQLQACAAIGQSQLMHLYTLAFARHRLTVAQVLLTQDDLASRLRFRNAKQTLLTLLHQRVIPIVNENDTVAVEEITFGDNDRLAALVAAAIDAHMLIVLSDVDGLLAEGKVVERVESIKQAEQLIVHGGGRQTTKGGMRSKLEAARIVGHSGIPMVIANGAKPSVLGDLLKGRSVGTLFVPPRDRLNARKWWIAFALRKPVGAIVIDSGAAHAITEESKSLLASGVSSVRGRFDVSAFVSVEDSSGTELARGVTDMSSADLVRVRGKSSAEAANLLGWARPKAVIHRNRLVLTKELHRA